MFLNVTLDYPFVGKIANEYPFLVTEMTSSVRAATSAFMLVGSTRSGSITKTHLEHS